MAHEDSCMLSIVDTNTGQKVGDIKLDDDHIEAMALEKSGPRMFVNLTTKSAIAVVDREKRTQIATWPNAEAGKANGPLAFDEANHRLFIVSRDPNKVIVMDSDSGKIVAGLANVGQFISDDAVYDPGSKRLYVAGTPFIDVFQQRSPNGYQLLGQMPTAFHSNTAILVPSLNRYYVAVNHHGTTDAMVQVYKVVP
jgi:DNA-binding beta-propeller fold protein YncE